MTMQQQGPPGQQATGSATGTSQYEQAGQQPGTGGQETGDQWTGGQGMTGQGGTDQGTGGQQPQPGGQAMTSQQMGSQGMGGQQIGLTLDDVLTGEMRLALEDFTEVAQVCEWCADQCIAEADPMMVECIRLCRDVADLARLNMALLARDSIFGPEAAETFAMAAKACADECAQHQHAHCQECARICRQAAESTWEMLATLGSSGPTTR